MKGRKQDASVVLDITTYETNLRKMTIYRTNKKKVIRHRKRYYDNQKICSRISQKGVLRLKSQIVIFPKEEDFLDHFNESTFCMQPSL